jgi:putative oxidoreductase
MPPEVDFALIILGRIGLGGYFLIAGIRNFTNLAVLDPMMEARKAPQPWLLLRVGLAVQTVAGAMVTLSLWPALGAFALAVFTIAANAMFHGFWEYTGEERKAHINSVLTNSAVVGGLLLVIATG